MEEIVVERGMQEEESLLPHHTHRTSCPVDHVDVSTHMEQESNQDIKEREAWTM
jgi:hypothetical protein